MVNILNNLLGIDNLDENIQNVATQNIRGEETPQYLDTRTATLPTPNVTIPSQQIQQVPQQIPQQIQPNQIQQVPQQMQDSRTIDKYKPFIGRKDIIDGAMEGRITDPYIVETLKQGIREGRNFGIPELEQDLADPNDPATQAKIAELQARQAQEQQTNVPQPQSQPNMLVNQPQPQPNQPQQGFAPSKRDALIKMLLAFGSSDASKGWGGMFADATGAYSKDITGQKKSEQSRNMYKKLGIDMPEGLDTTQQTSFLKLDKEARDRSAKLNEALVKAKDKSGTSTIKGEFMAVMNVINSPEFTNLPKETQQRYLDFADTKAKGTDTLFGQQQATQQGKYSGQIGFIGKAEEEKETGKQTAQLNLAPEVERQKAIAKQQGKDLVTAEEEYNEIKSKMPTLEKTINELKDIGEIATYTKALQFRDNILRQSGLPMSTSGIARAEYDAKVKNQILPLLRSTFGAQFTENEGKSLLATLGDPNMSPQEKSIVLDTFIKQKNRDVEDKHRKIQMSRQQVQPTQENTKTMIDSEGTVQRNKRTGQTRIMRGGQWQIQ